MRWGKTGEVRVHNQKEKAGSERNPEMRAKQNPQIILTLPVKGI